MPRSERKLDSHEVRLQTLESLSERVWDKNPKKYNTPAIFDSLGKYGYADPIIIDDASGQIVGGQGVLAVLLMAHAAQEPAPKHIQIGSDGQWLIPCLHIRLKEGEAPAYSVARNRTQELGGWDEALLVDILKEIQETDPMGLLGTGFTDTDLNVLQQKVGGELPATFKQVAPPPLPEPAPTAPPLGTVPASPPAAPPLGVAPPGAVATVPFSASAPAATVTRTVNCPHCGEVFTL